MHKHDIAETDDRQSLSVAGLFIHFSYAFLYHQFFAGFQNIDVWAKQNVVRRAVPSQPTPALDSAQHKRGAAQIPLRAPRRDVGTRGHHAAPAELRFPLCGSVPFLFLLPLPPFPN